MGSWHCYECKTCGHCWEAWELGISMWECEMCGSPDLKDLGEVDKDNQDPAFHDGIKNTLP